MNKHLQFNKIICYLSFLLLLVACLPDDNLKNEINNDDDMTIGQTIDITLQDYFNNNNLLMDTNAYSSAYAYINNLVFNIKNAASLTDYASNLNVRLNQSIRIINQPGVSTAFIIPGGYIYIYKDLLKALNNEAQLASIIINLAYASCNRIAIDKLERRFSLSFLIDLALGGEVNINKAMLLEELNNIPYDTTVVSIFNEPTENTICELDYNIRAYSDLLIQNSTNNIHWLSLFPRNNTEYASYLHNDLKDSPICVNANTENIQAYTNFKTYLD